MRKTILAFILLFAVISVDAQSKTSHSSSYRTALGVKFWDGGGISFKHFVTDQNAIELIGFFWNEGTRITGLYEIHGPIKGVAGLKWYIGPGAHLGFYNTNHGDGSFVGIDGVIGLDLKFTGAPINMSLDWQPSFEFGTNRGFVDGWLGFAIRYTF